MPVKFPRLCWVTEGRREGWVDWVYVCFRISKDLHQEVSTWSRGMIHASGAGGPGFEYRSGPTI